MERPKLDTLFLAYRTSGDATALAQVFDLAAPELYELARRLSPDRSGAEDVLQDTFVTAIEKRASWNEHEPLLPWLIGILAIASQRRRRERARTVDPERLTQSEVERPEAGLAKSELRAELEATLSALSTEERSLVEQRLLQDRTPRDMARERGLSVTTLRMRLSRALARLRRVAPSSLSWALLPWGTRRALHNVRLHVLPSAAPTLAPFAIGAAILGIAAVAGALGMLAQRSPERLNLLAATGETSAPMEPAGSQSRAAPSPTSVAKGAEATEGATAANERNAMPSPVRLYTVEAPPAEGEWVAPPVPDNASRQRLQLLVTREGVAVPEAMVLRMFPDAGFEGIGYTNSRGRVDIDIVLQASVKLCVSANACRNAYFEVEPEKMNAVEERTVALEPGPEPAFVTFRFGWAFPPGFVAQFVPIDLLNGQRPNLGELYKKFPKVACLPECVLSRVDSEGFLEHPIVPGHYWVLARHGDITSPESPDLLPCCFELTIPEGQFFECEYPGSVGGSIVLDVLGPATIGADVAVSIEEDTVPPRKLWFQVYRDGDNYMRSTDINVGTLNARSEQIVRGEELRLAISP
jgi:RNA polymerase sigma-70 factor (ECF subfamily)